MVQQQGQGAEDELRTRSVGMESGTWQMIDKVAHNVRGAVAEVQRDPTMQTSAGRKAAFTLLIYILVGVAVVNALIFGGRRR